MLIDILADPPADMLDRKKHYAVICRKWLGLVCCSFIIGFAGVCFTLSFGNLLANIGIGLFVISGAAFVFYTEKYMDYRRISHAQRAKLNKLILEFGDIGAYHQKVVSANRFMTVLEYEAAENHAHYCRSQKKASESGEVK